MNFIDLMPSLTHTFSHFWLIIDLKQGWKKEEEKKGNIFLVTLNIEQTQYLLEVSKDN